MLKRYCVVYLSEGGSHYRYRCYAKSVGFAKKYCCQAMGCKQSAIVDVYEED